MTYDILFEEWCNLLVDPILEDLSDLEWEAEPDLPAYDFDGRAYHLDGTRWPDYDATIYSGVK